MSSRSARNVDSESRKPKLPPNSKAVIKTSKSNTVVPKSYKFTSDDEHLSEQSDSDLEHELDMPVKDDSRRKNTAAPKARKFDTKSTSLQTQSVTTVETKQESTSVTLSPVNVMTASVYHVPFAPNIYPNPSTYVPTTNMFFYALNSLQRVVYENTYLRYDMPGYITPVTTLYYSMIVIIQILRAGNACNLLTRQEQSALKLIERGFPFESLPIAGPLVPFLQVLGAVIINFYLFLILYFIFFFIIKF